VSLLFGEVELMETHPGDLFLVQYTNTVASLRRSGINGNSISFLAGNARNVSLLFGEVELMETFLRVI